jgi:DNA-binding transcriptional MerR regulator
MAKKTAEELWTIGELTDRVAAALAGNFAGVASGRVRDVPDLRAIRYYTTIGLLDRPVELRGRTALYANRHLYQLVAIKRLQAQGLRLARVQERLLNLADRELEKLADVKPGFDDISAARSSNDNQPRSPRQKLKPSARRLDFWKSSPATPPAPAADDDIRPARRPDVLTLVPLAEGLSIGFEACRAVTADDIAALQAAAEHVRQVLIQRRLVTT